MKLKKKKAGKPWFDREAHDIIKKRKHQKEKCLNSQKEEDKNLYNSVNRETTKLLRRKKRNWLNGLVTKAEEDRTKNNAKDFYRSVRYFKKGYTPKAYGVKDRNGRVIIQEEEGLEVWKEYFENLLNGEEVVDQDNNEQYQNVQPNIDPPTLDEVIKAIQCLKNNKAPGEDGISAETIKAGGETLAKAIHVLILEIWENEHIPDEWKESVVILIYKKGDKQECSNYRGISLINCTYKVLSKILLKRLETYYTDSIIEDHQSGFIKGRSTTDQIFIVKECIAM